MADRAAVPKVVETSLKRFKVATADTKQRAKELDDLRFAAGTSDNGYQWPADYLTVRGGQTINGQTVPARPSLTINKLIQPIQQQTNQYQSAHLAIQVSPKGESAASHTAEMLQGLIRHIQVESNATQKRGWAFQRTVKCGRGAYRILKKYANDEDDELDLAIERILNQSAVSFDPFAQQPDWSDMEWCHIVDDMPLDRYQREFPDSDILSLGNDALTAIGNDAPGWVTGDEEGRTIRVAEYYYIEHTAVPAPKSARKRTIDKRSVKWVKHNAIEVLDSQDEDGQYIPVIPTIGREENINGERIFEGIVGPAKDGQRARNYDRSAQVETGALAPRAAFIGAEGQFEGHPEWDLINVKNFGKVEYRQVDLNGKPAPPPQRAQGIDGATIMALSNLIQHDDDDIRATTGVWEESLGTTNLAQKSGKAIRSLQAQSEAGNSHFLNNLAEISMTLEGKILLDLIPYVYDRPGRIVKILGTDDEPQAVMLGKPFTKGQDGQPVEAPPQTPDAVFHDLKAGAYSVTVKVGKSSNTLRQEGSEAIGQLLEAAPQLAPLIADIWVGKMDFPGAQPIADRLKKALPPQFQDEQANQAQAAQQKLAQLEPMVEALTKELNAKNHLIEQEKAANDTKIAVARIQGETAVAVAEIKAGIDQMRTQFEAAISGIQQQVDQQHEHIQNTLDRAHEAGMQQMQQSHEQDQQAAQQGHEQQIGAQQHEQALEQQAAAPKPASNT